MRLRVESFPANRGPERARPAARRQRNPFAALCARAQCRTIVPGQIVLARAILSIFPRQRDEIRDNERLGRLFRRRDGEMKYRGQLRRTRDLI